MFDLPAVRDRLEAAARHLRSGGSSLALAECVDLVGECQAVVSAAQGLQTLALAHVAAIEDIALEDGTVVEEFRGLGHERLDGPALVADDLGLTAQGASGRMSTAVHLASQLPELVQAMAAGKVDAYRAGVVSDELREASQETCREVVSRLLPHLGREPGGALRRRTRRVVAAVDAESLRTRAERARQERSLCRRAGEPGVDEWVGSFPVEQSRSGWACVDRLARQYVREGRNATVEQARADALMDLVHGKASGEYVVQVAVPMDRLVGDRTTGAVPEPPASQPLVRSGSATDSIGVDADVLQRIGDAVLEAQRAGHLRLVPSRAALVVQVAPCHPETGALVAPPVPVPLRERADAVTAQGADERTPFAPANRISPQPTRRGLADLADQASPRQSPGAHRRRRHATKAYRPPAWMVDLVRARDGTCRFPGCAVPARSCDLDHVRPWPAGATTPENLACLCRRHHRVKQRHRWRVAVLPGARLLWTDPTGMERITLPVDHLRPEPEPWLDRAPNPKTAQVEGRPMSAAHMDALWSSLEDELELLLEHAAKARARTLPTGESRAATALLGDPPY